MGALFCAQELPRSLAVQHLDCLEGHRRRPLNGRKGFGRMTEQTSTAVAGEQNEQGQEQPKEFEAITSQEDFDKAIQARIARERAKFADYDDVKAKAEKLAEIEAANLTEAEKIAARAEAAEKRAADLEVKVARAEVAAAKGVPADLLTGSTKEELEKAAEALIAFRGEKVAARLTIPNADKRPAKPGNGDEREFAKTLFRKAD